MKAKLQRVIEGANQFVLPLFQRKYSWDRKEWNTLGKTYWNCLRRKADAITTLLDIDLQQRFQWTVERYVRRRSCFLVASPLGFVRRNRGLAKQKKGDNGGAIADFDRAIKLGSQRD